MQEKLSIKKVYIDALRYVATHLGAFAFLTVFYFLGSLMPMYIGTTSFKILMIPYYYLFLYFAAGCYYKQQILWDRRIFFAATVRFFTTVLLFAAILALSSYMINAVFDFISTSLLGGKLVVSLILKSATWEIARYFFMFILVIVFFVIPSFAFVSEISGKNRSLLTTYIKTKGNVLRISIITFIASVILIFVIWLLIKFINPVVVELIRAVLLVFCSIIYFKMYDFFYCRVTSNKSEKKKKSEPEQKEILLADAKSSKKDTNNDDTKSETSKEKKLC